MSHICSKPQNTLSSLVLKSEFCRICSEILSYHERDLEDNGMVELSQIKTRKLLYLFEPVHKSVSMYEKLSRCFRYVQIILKELLDSKESFVVKRLDAAFLEYLLEESFAQRSRQVVNKSCNTEIVV